MCSETQRHVVPVSANGQICRSREKLAPVGRVMCKCGEDLAWRSAHVNGGAKIDGGGVEEVKIDGFAGEQPNLLTV